MEEHKMLKEKIERFNQVYQFRQSFKKLSLQRNSVGF